MTYERKIKILYIFLIFYSHSTLTLGFIPLPDHFGILGLGWDNNGNPMDDYHLLGCPESLSEVMHKSRWVVHATIHAALKRFKAAISELTGTILIVGQHVC